MTEDDIPVASWQAPAEPLPFGEELPSSRVPHFGHALLFLVIAGLLLLLAQATLLLPIMRQSASSVVKHMRKNAFGWHATAANLSLKSDSQLALLTLQPPASASTVMIATR